MLSKKFWEKYFINYDFLNSLIPYQSLLSSLCKELKINKFDKVLDAGCGTGNLALMIKNNGGDVIGFDNCEEALKVYRKRVPGAKTVFGDLINELPFPEDFFDRIVSNNALYTIEKSKQIFVLKEFYRVLRPGGKIVLSNPMTTGKPVKIYLEHIRISSKENGVLKTIRKLFTMLIPTIKMFIFNIYIKRNCYSSLFQENEQENLLSKTGFVKVSPTRLTYANQNVFNSAIKPN